MKLQVMNLGRIEYRKALEMQEKLLSLRQAGKTADTLILLELPPVITIGLAVKRWVTMHGFAFNVNTDLEHFRWINPCGITDKGVTSLKKILGCTLDFDKINDMVIRYFGEVFDVQPEIKDSRELYNLLEGE